MKTILAVCFVVLSTASGCTTTPTYESHPLRVVSSDPYGVKIALDLPHGMFGADPNMSLQVKQEYRRKARRMARKACERHDKLVDTSAQVLPVSDCLQRGYSNLAGTFCRRSRHTFFVPCK